MYRKILLLFIFFLLSQTIITAKTVVTQTPYHNPNRVIYSHNHQRNNFYNPYYHNNEELASLEQYSLNKNFQSESDLKRLNRLEMLAFGAVQQGDFDTRYERVRRAILSRPKVPQKNSAWKNAVNYFSGQLTGFTPSIVDTNQDYNFTPYSRNTSTFDYANPFGRHSRTNSYWGGNGSHISILD